jgi:molybdenum cofactor biosynthesis protein B
MSAHRHHEEAASRPVECFVLTVSDSRTAATDRSGQLIRQLLEGAGHRVTGAAIVPDDPDQIRSAVQGALEAPGTEVVLVTGGTGISRRDCTVDTIRPMLERELDGFGEIFRALSFREIGPAAMLSRAVAGVVGGRAIFVMPGSTDAVKLALKQLILPEIGHVAGELLRGGAT